MYRPSVTKIRDLGLYRPSVTKIRDSGLYRPSVTKNHSSDLYRPSVTKIRDSGRVHPVGDSSHLFARHSAKLNPHIYDNCVAADMKI